MNQLKELPIGIEDFETVIDHCYYVDKTMLIKDVVDFPESTVYLITRPRRFGKSLALSMLESFFDQKKNSRRLFEDKKVAKTSKDYLRFLNSRPVIHLNFKNLAATNFASLSLLFKNLIRAAYGQEETIGSSDKLNAVERQYFSSVVNDALDMASYMSSIGNLVKFEYEAYGRKPVLLIDEYDTPILSSRDNGYYKEAITFFRNVLGEALKGNDSLGISVVTGVMRIAKESIFSGINNLRSSSALDPAFEEFFGFTDKETKDLLSYYGGADSFDAAERWYGGYHYGDIEVFNPLSILRFVEKNFETGEYWSNTSSNSLISEIITPDLTPFLSDLLQGKAVEQKIDDAIPFESISSNISSLSSVLLASGYLTLEDKLGDRRYTLKIPNQEIKALFQDEIVDRYLPKIPSGTLARDLSLALRNKDTNRFSELIETSFLQSFSYYDFNSEKNYQILVLTITCFLFGANRIKSEVNAGEGRADIIVYPSNEDAFSSVIEIKFSKSRLSASQMIERCKVGISQIKQKNYQAELVQYKKPILLLGLCFSKNKAESVAETIEP